MKDTPSPASVRVLAALARGALAESYSPDVHRRMIETLELLSAPADVRQMLAALGAADTKAGAWAMTGRPIPVSWLSAEEAEAVLQRWKNSRISAQRHLASVVISLAMTAAYGHPGPEWERIGYPGPLGPPPTTKKNLAPVRVEDDTELYCDVVVVGSGAGGGCVAAGLVAAGFDVVVLEKGGYRAESDFHHVEGDAFRDLYLYGGTLATTNLSCRILAGSTLGGGTVVNYTTSFKTPKPVLEEWAQVSGIDAFASGEFEASLDEASARLGVNTNSSAAGRRDVLLEEGLKKLGWHVDMMPRAVRGCTQDEQCGYCGFGCRVAGKQSSMRTYLEDASAGGARIVVDANVRKVHVRDGRAVGVDVKVGPRTLTVNASATVIAAGAIETPALLLRSGLRGQVGRNLHLHPGTGVLGIFDDEVRMWEGTTQARYSNHLVHWDGGYGPMLETVPVHPGSAAASFPWVSSAHHREFMGNLARFGLCAVLPRDKTAGRVRIDRAGNPRVHYSLSDDDERRIADGVVCGAQALAEAGARTVCSLHPQFLSYEPATAGGFEQWSAATKAQGYRKGATLVSYHQMSSCRMGTDPGTSAVDANNESHEVPRLFVTDASCFPTASGVNPMLSVYGIATRAARKITERLG